MLIVCKLLFKSSNESSALLNIIEQIDHVSHALAVTIKKLASTCHFKVYIFKIFL